MTFDFNSFGTTVSAPTRTGSFDFNSFGSDTSPLPIAPKPKSIWDEIVEQAQGGIKQGVSGIEDINSGTGNPIQKGIKGALKVGSGVVTTAFSPLAPAFNRTIVPAFDAAQKTLAETKPFQEYGRAIAYSSDKPLGESILEDLANAGNIAGGILGARVPGKTAELTPRVPSAVSSLTARSEQSIEAAITRNFDKGVKPLLPGKTTPTKLTQYHDDALTAIKAIRDNKQNLRFTDDVGDTIAGETPKTLLQLSEALEQTKKTVFAQYDALAKQAGDAGVAVDLSKLSGELDAVISNKALQLTNPRAIQYAQDLQARLSKTGDIDAITAQEVIQNYNKSLEAFYRNPSYDNASQAAIDAMIANRLRTALDEKITSLTGEGYGKLKQTYGALKAIERDVIKASLRDARKNIKGLIDFTDILSGGQVVNGILSLNPATIAQGVAGKAISQFYKYLNDPNRAIQKMFGDAEKLPQRFNQSTTLGNSRLQSQPPTTIATIPTTNTNIPNTIPFAAQRAISDHLTTAETILKELPKAQLAKNGGLPALFERTRTNIADGLEAQGFNQLAQHIRTFDLTPFKSFEAFKEALWNYIKNIQPGLSMKRVNPFDDFTPHQQAFLAKASQRIPNLTAQEWEMLQSLLKSKGYQVPSTQLKAGVMLNDMFKSTRTTRELTEQATVDETMDASLHLQRLPAQEQGRDALGRFTNNQ